MDFRVDGFTIIVVFVVLGSVLGCSWMFLKILKEETNNYQEIRKKQVEDIQKSAQKVKEAAKAVENKLLKSREDVENYALTTLNHMELEALNTVTVNKIKNVLLENMIIQGNPEEVMHLKHKTLEYAEKLNALLKDFSDPMIRLEKFSAATCRSISSFMLEASSVKQNGLLQRPHPLLFISNTQILKSINKNPPHSRKSIFFDEREAKQFYEERDPKVLKLAELDFPFINNELDTLKSLCDSIPEKLQGMEFILQPGQ